MGGVSAPALWTKHRPLASAVASGYRISGLDRDDTRQEALIALWIAARSHDPAVGHFPPYARTLIHRRLTDLLRTATREKRRAVIVELVDVEQSEHGREQLRAIVALLPTLTVLERQAVAAQLDGSYRSADRRLENALQAARRKLRAGLADPAATLPGR